MTGSPPMVLPRQSGSLATEFDVFLRGQQFAQVDLLAMLVRQFDADGVAAGDHGDARRHRAHRAGDVVGEADHARRLDAGRGLEFVQRDDRARMGIGDLAAHAEILQHAFERAELASSSALLSVLRSDAFGAVSTDIGGSTNLSEDFLRRLRGAAFLRGARAAGSSSSSSSSSSSVLFFVDRRRLAGRATEPARPPRLGSLALERAARRLRRARRPASDRRSRASQPSRAFALMTAWKSVRARSSRAIRRLPRRSARRRPRSSSSSSSPLLARADAAGDHEGCARSRRKQDDAEHQAIEEAVRAEQRRPERAAARRRRRRRGRSAAAMRRCAASSSQIPRADTVQRIQQAMRSASRSK